MFDVRHRGAARHRTRAAAVGVLVGILSLGAVPAVAATPSPTPVPVEAGSLSETATDAQGAPIADADPSVVLADDGAPTEAATQRREPASEDPVTPPAAEPSAAPRDSATYSVNVRLTGDGGGSLDAYVTLIGETASTAGFTDPSGGVLLTHVPPGSYNLDVYPSDVNYAPYWQRLEVRGDTVVDVALQGPGSVSGRVTSTDADTVDVRLLRVEDLHTEKEARVVDGVFRIDQVRPGRYILEADPNGGTEAPTLYPGVSDPSDATVVTVGPAGTVEGLDVALVAGRSITGAVTGVPLLSPHASAIAAPIEWNGRPVSLFSRRGDTTVGRDGRYTITGLAADDYLVSVDGYRQVEADLGWQYLSYTGYYKDSPTLSGATPVPVRGENVGGIDIDLRGHGTVSGEVGAEGGAPPVENTLITAYRWNGATWDEILSVSGWGRYSLGTRSGDVSHGLPSGTYIVGFSDPDTVNGDDGIDYPYCPQYWNGRDTFESAGRFEVVADEDTSSIDATLRLKSSGCAANGVVPGAPTIVGTPRVGDVLTADPGSWAPLPIQLAYQWRANGVDIDGATSKAFTPTEAQTGTTLTVAVTGSRPGYDSTTVVSPDSAPVGAAAPGTVRPGQPTLSGPALSGVPLVVSPGDWGPRPVDLTYQWSLDGEPIDGATGAGYTPTARDVGRRLTVSVTGTKPGYTPATTVVDAGAVSASISVGSSSVLPGGSVVVTGSGFEPGETVRVELHSTVIPLGAAVADADGNVRLPVTLPLGVMPGEHHLFAIGERSGRVASVPITIGSSTAIGGGTASPSTSPSPALADTGTTVPIALTVLGILFALGGAVLLRRPARRRR